MLDQAQFFVLISAPLFISSFWLIYFVLNGLRESREKQNPSHQPALTAISAFYLAATLLYGCHFLYFAGQGSAVRETVYGTCNLCVYPLFYLYIISLAGKGKSNERETLVGLSLLFLPALLVAVGYTVCYAGGFVKVRGGFHLFARIAFALQVVFVWIFGSRMLRRYRDELDDYYSDNRSHELCPLHILLQLFGAIAIASALMNLIGREWFVGKSLIALPSLLMSVLLYALGYVAAELARNARSTESLDNMELLENADNPELTENVDNPAGAAPKSASLAARLEQLMLTEKPYLRPDLTVQDLAKILGTNRTYLSQTFRDELGISFSTYINRLRIEYAKQILSDSSFSTNKEAILAAQTESGFASESTFYHLFKQHTGMTPLQWRSQSNKSSSVNV